LCQVGFVCGQSPFSLESQKNRSNAQEVSVLFDFEIAQSIEFDGLNEMGYLIPISD